MQILMAFSLEIPIRRFKSVGVSVWGHIRIHIDENQTPMMFKVVTSDGDVLLQFIFSLGLKLNTETYIKWLK